MNNHFKHAALEHGVKTIYIINNEGKKRNEMITNHVSLFYAKGF